MNKEYEKDRVSVIIPIYNAEKYVEKTLASVFAQSYRNIEIVLVDDCSKDKSAEIIAQLKKQHPEIIYFLQAHHLYFQL